MKIQNIIIYNLKYNSTTPNNNEKFDMIKIFSLFYLTCVYEYFYSKSWSGCQLVPGKGNFKFLHFPLMLQ